MTDDVTVEIDVRFDDEAKVWCAVARPGVGLVTEAETLDELVAKVRQMVDDLELSRTDFVLEVTL